MIKRCFRIRNDLLGFLECLCGFFKLKFRFLKLKNLDFDFSFHHRFLENIPMKEYIFYSDGETMC